MRLCKKHYREIERVVGKGREKDIVEAISRTMLLFFDGDKYDWNPNMVFFDIETQYKGCPVCALSDDYKEFIKGYLKGEYDYDGWKNSRKEND